MKERYDVKSSSEQEEKAVGAEKVETNNTMCYKGERGEKERMKARKNGTKRKKKMGDLK